MSRSWLYWSSRGAVLAALALFLGTGVLLAQTGSIEGTVRNAQTASPISGTRVSVRGTELAATSNQNGYYRIDGVPVGTHDLQAVTLGFNAVTVTNAVVTANRSLTVNIEMLPAVINLDAVVVTGVIGETQRAKLAFTVDQIKTADLPVPQVDPISALQGKVSGAIVMRGSGQPGTAPTILLRGPTSINASGRSQEPLYVVDGVILGSSIVDLDALDIENIEVIKGAAAASLYGSRAASGVVQITTRRGSSLAAEEIRFTARAEYGSNQLPRKMPLAKKHQFLMNSTGTKFIDNFGEECDWLACPNVVLAGQGAGLGLADPTVDGTANEWTTYMNQTWPGTTWDQVDRFFEGGNFGQYYVSAEGRTGGTNFHASYSNLREEGIMTGQEGQWRNNFRVNVDQRLGDAFKIGASAFYSRGKVDNVGGSLFGLTRMPAGADLLALNTCYEPDPADCGLWQEPRMIMDENGNEIQDPKDVYLNPDPFNQESPNPLYELFNIESYGYRGRFQSSANVRWRPLDWLSFDGNVSYDRLDYKSQYYRFKGYKSFTDATSTILGGMTRNHALTEAFNWSLDATLSKRFGDLATRTQFRYLAEYDDYESTNAGGSRFTVGEVPVIDNLDPDFVTAGSYVQAVRADGYFGITNLEYKERYIVDALVRNDGSSLFGPDARRHWYYRLAGAWRLSEDLRIPGFDELKLRAAYGTAGGRPSFAAQYETYSVGSGSVTPVTLGNRNLEPEYSKELEIGTDMLIGGMVGLTVTYAQTTTENQILLVPLPAYAGFTQQWRNAGTLDSKTWEAMLDLQAIQTRDMSWTFKFIFDRTQQEITELNVPAFTYGAYGGNSADVFYARPGEAIGTMYGVRFAKSCDDLLGQLGGADCLVSSGGEFEINDEGLLVWVGPGGSLSNPQWGASGPSFGFNGQSRTLRWGSPVRGWGIDRVTNDTTDFLPVGSTVPDFHLGFGTTFRWKGFQVYGLLEWTQGFEIYNVPAQWAVFRNYSAIQDQPDGLPLEEQKPQGYYNQLYGLVGLGVDNYFVQDGSFAKLREVSVRYRFDRAQLASVPLLRAFDGIALSLIGRNLLTFTSYPSYDPETGSGGGEVGSAAVARVDGYQYPNFRTFTGAIEINF
jgi:TonB-linked SusC/RagA family outer membrane protein